MYPGKVFSVRITETYLRGSKNKITDNLLNRCSRGVGAMEIVAMDMKLRGTYIARQLSFHGVTFKIEEVPLTKEFIKMYDDSVMLVRMKLFLKIFVKLFF